MFKFISGFFVGFLFKKHLTYIITSTYCIWYDKFKNKVDKVTEVILVCKTDELVETQPYWEHNSDKQIVKIDLTKELKDYFNNSTGNTSFEELFNLKENDERLVTLYLPYFQEIGTCYLYVYYTINNKNYINVYSSGNIINSFDFKKVNGSNKFYDIICSYVKTGCTKIYITDYIKMYGNNTINLKPKLLFYERELDNNSELIILDKTGTKIYLNDEVI